MNKDNLSKRDINVLGSYWGILKHANCRHLWFKYMNVKDFKDLNINVHKRRFIQDILGIPVIVTSAKIVNRKGTNWLKFECSYSLDDVNTEDVLIGTSAELLIEAALQLNAKSFPFKTIIIKNDSGFYEFT